MGIYFTREVSKLRERERERQRIAGASGKKQRERDAAETDAPRRPRDARCDAEYQCKRAGRNVRGQRHAEWEQ